MSRLTRSLAVLLAFAALPTVAGAQSQRAIRDACLPDVRALCSGVQPGGGRLVVCLDDNRAKLSPTCAKVLPSSDAIRARFGG